MASLEQSSGAAGPIPPAPAAPFTGGWAQVPAPAQPGPAFGINPVVPQYAKPSGPRFAQVTEMQVMISRLLLVVYVGGMAYVIYKFFDHEIPKGMPSEIVSLIHRFQWAFIISRVLLVAAITAPLLLVAELLAGALMKFRTAENNYLRAAGIAGLVDASLLSMVAFGPDSNTTRYVLIGLIVAAAAAAIWYTYGLKLIEAAATAGLSAAAFVAAWFAVSPIQIAIATSGIVPLKTTVKGESFVLPVDGIKDRPAFVLLLSDDEERIRRRLKEKEEEKGRASSQGFASSFGASPAAPPGAGQGNPSQTAPNTARFKALLDGFVREKGTGNLSREAARKKLDELQAAMNREWGQHAEIAMRDPDWGDLQTALMLEKSKINRELPSEEPPTDVHLPLGLPKEQFVPDAAIVATLSANEDVMDIHRIRLPVNVRKSLGNGTTDSQGTTRWTWDIPGATLTVTIMPKRGGQGQAWVMTHDFMRKTAQAQFDGKATKRAGHINGLGMLRVDHSAPGLSPAWIEYVGSNRYSQWVSLRATSPTGDLSALKTLETSILTLRREAPPAVAVTPSKPGLISPATSPIQPPPNAVQRPAIPASQPAVAAAAPLTFAQIAEIINNDYFNSKDVIRRYGPRAEAAIVEALTRDDHRVKRIAIELLPDIATTASIDKLKPLASSHDRDLAKTVQAVLQKLAPAQFDSVSGPLADLKTDDVFRRRDAMKALAEMTPVEARRDDVTRALEAIVLDGKFGFDGDEAATALRTWASIKTANKLIPLLNNPKLDLWQRRRLLKAISGAHDSKPAAGVVIKWLVLSPDEVVAALTYMGPIAEDDVIRVLLANFSGKNHDAQVARASCARILSDIGTAKSLDVLGRVSRDTRDPAAQAIATTALDAVKGRIASKAATKPAVSPASGPAK
jgi:hypothetical protein